MSRAGSRFREGHTFPAGHTAQGSGTLNCRYRFLGNSCLQDRVQTEEGIKGAREDVHAGKSLKLEGEQAPCSLPQEFVLTLSLTR